MQSSPTKWFFAGILLFSLLFFREVAAKTPQRIVSLKPNVTEILFAIGVGSSVVGVTNYCDFPEGAKKIQRVGSFLEPNVEAIVALRPTLIIGEKSGSREPVLLMQKMGFKVLLLDFDHLQSLYASIHEIGVETGASENADALNLSLKTGLRPIALQAKSLRVLVVVGKDPLIAVGKGNFLHEMLEAMGAENIAKEGVSKFPRFSEEAVIAAKPRVIFDVSMGSEDARLRQNRGKHYWKRFSSVPAVQENHVYFLNPDLLLRPGPRLIEGFNQMAAALKKVNP